MEMFIQVPTTISHDRNNFFQIYTQQALTLIVTSNYRIYITISNPQNLIGKICHLLPNILVIFEIFNARLFLKERAHQA